MKKVVVLLIGLVYVASVVLISYFGMELKSYDVIIYATSVEFENEGIQEVPFSGEMRKILYVDYTEDGMRFPLEWSVYPDIATKKDVKFTVGNNYDIEINDRGMRGMLRINQFYQAFTVTVMALDGSKKQDSLYIILNDVRGSIPLY